MSGPRLLRLAEDPPEAVLLAFLDAAAAGELLIFPTDTVYGLGARADSPEALETLFAVKRRPAELALPILVGDRAGLDGVIAAWPPAAEAVASAFWPGPLTLVLPRAPGLSPRVTGGRDSVGVRMPDHPALLSWLCACPFPLAVTSANLSGQPEAVALEEIPAELQSAVAVVVDGGRCPGGEPSTVVDLTGGDPRVLRPGPITESQIISRL